MPRLGPGIHVFLYAAKTWMAGHRRAEATPSFRRLCPAMTKSFSSPQQPLPRHMIEFEPDAIGVFEQDRIISRRPSILARRADDLGVERAQKGMQLVNVGALAGAEAE